MKKLEIERAEWRMTGDRVVTHCVFSDGAGWVCPKWDEAVLTDATERMAAPVAVAAIVDRSLAQMCKEVSRDYLRSKDEAAEADLIARALEIVAALDQ